MASLRRKQFLRPLPKDAEVLQVPRKKKDRDDSKQEPQFDLIARWKQDGKSKTAPVQTSSGGSLKIRVECANWMARYRDADGLIVERSTGCRDKQAAAAVLSQWQRRVELVKAGVVSKSEDRIADYAATPLADHLADYRDCLQAKGTTERHRQEVEQMASRVFSDCGMKTLSDVEAAPIERWLNARQSEGMGARNRNGFLQAVKQFCKWAFESSRMATMPLARLKKANEKTDRRHQRRALSEAELARLFFAARWRALAEAGRETVADDAEAGKRAGWHYVELRFGDIREAVERARQRLQSKNPKLLAELDRAGQMRELAYRTMTLTGLRRGELASLTLKNAWLDNEPPRFSLNAAQTKNRTDAQIVLRSDLAAEVRQWIAQLTSEGRTMEDRIFTIPDRRAFLRLFDADLELAGIPKHDDRGRVADVHCLRHSFATSLARSGASPKTAQTLLRHSDINLTMSVYSHSEFSDLVSSLDALPTYRATGTTLATRSEMLLPPILPPTGGKPCLLMAYTGTDEEQRLPILATATKTENPEKTSVFSGSHPIGVTGFEPATPWSQTRCSSQAELHSEPKRAGL